MGPRAYVEFPTYEISNALQDEHLVYQFGDQTGTIYVFTNYDGDVLPVDLRETFLRILRHNGHVYPEAPEWLKLRNLEPEWVAAQLVHTLVEDDRDAAVYIYTYEPQMGYRIICDFKTGTISYEGQRERTEPIAKWIKRESGLVFTAAAEDNMESGV